MNLAASSHPSVLSLHEHQLGLLPTSSAASVGDHLASCERCRLEYDELAASHRAFDRSVLPRTIDAVGARRARSRWWRWSSVGGALATAGALVLLLATVPPKQVSQGPLGVKGGHHLTLHAARQGMLLPQAAPLAPGDEIRFVIRPAGYAYVMIGSIDAAGRATIYLPFDGPQSAAVPPGTSIWEHPVSIELDETLGPERLFLLMGHRPLASAQVRAALEAIGRAGAESIRTTDRLPVEVDVQESLLIEKRAE